MTVAIGQPALCLLDSTHEAVVMSSRAKTETGSGQHNREEALDIR